MHVLVWLVHMHAISLEYARSHLHAFSFEINDYLNRQVLMFAISLVNESSFKDENSIVVFRGGALRSVDKTL